MKSLAALCLSALLVLPFAADAEAGRAPNSQELAQIEHVLHAAGFTRWEEIELEDNGTVWEVDDAIGSDGREYDLKLSVDTLEIIEKKRD